MHLKQFDTCKNMFYNDVMLTYSCHFHITVFMCQFNDLAKLLAVKATKMLTIAR